MPVTDVDRLAPVRDWLTTASLAGMPIEELVTGLARQLNALDLHVGRINIATRVLNPLIRAENWIYERRTDRTIAERFAHTPDAPEVFRASPFSYMVENQVLRMHRFLQGPQAKLDYPVLAEFARRGYTEWKACLIGFRILPDEQPGDTLGFVASLCSDAAAKWTAAEHAALDSLLPMLANAVQGRLFAGMAQGLLDTYLGGDAARRVLKGTIQRGDVRSIRAVLLYADLRGFSALSETLPPEQLIIALDRHLECAVAPVEAAGGQVLKFLGDGLLATFATEGIGEREACRQAMAAARQALDRIAALPRESGPVLPLDIALHLGNVLYGNVGSGARLDFTVIGPAVNEAARMELLCKAAGVPITISRPVAELLQSDGVALRSLGHHALPGHAGTREIFTLG
jgi:adenylate cyclase